MVALDAPAKLGGADELSKRSVGGESGEPVFERLGVALGPFDQQPFLGAGLGQIAIPGRASLTRTAAKREPRSPCSFLPASQWSARHIAAVPEPTPSPIPAVLGAAAHQSSECGRQQSARQLDLSCHDAN